MKNGGHLEAAGSIKLKKAYLNSEKNSVSLNNHGFFGYFCLRTNRLFVNRVVGKIFHESDYQDEECDL